MMKHQSNAKFYLLFILIFMFSISAEAQKVTCSGTVLSATDGEPIIGATISQVGVKSNVAVTNLDGHFSINVPIGSAIKIGYIGYSPQTVKATKNMTVRLSERSQSLNDVVVIGYGTAKKSDISGSVASVDVSNTMKRSPLNTNQMLKGTPGVEVTSTGGDPTGSTVVRIRGIASINNGTAPLYVVDGIQVGNEANFINPQDIKSIEVLKDASSTAIYGSQGANGVILITTKQGEKGQLHVNAKADWGIQTRSMKFDVLNADEYAQAVRMGHANEGGNIIMPIWSEKYDGLRKNIDWQDEMIKTSLKQNYSASVQGGSDKLQGIFSVNWLNNDGMAINSNYDRLTVRAAISGDVNKYLTLGGSMNFEHAKWIGTSAYAAGYAVYTPTMDYTDDLGNIISPNVVNADGTYGTFYQTTGVCEIGSGTDNSYAVRKENDSPSRDNLMLMNMFAEVNIIKGLKFKAIYSYDARTTDNYSWNTARERYNNGEKVTLVGTDYNSFGLSESSTYRRSIEDYLTYSFRNKIHSLTVMLGNSSLSSWGRWVASSSNKFLAENIRSIQLTTDAESISGQGAFDMESRYLSYYGRVMYGLLDRYNLTATIRRDGSSNFGKGNRWGTFPSFAASWRISEEPFMKDVKFVSNMKLRFGWGRTGNAGSATNNAVEQLSSSGMMYHFYADGASSQTFSTMTGVAQSKVVDTNLKWETNEQTNFGLDLGLFNNTLNITLDYYIRNTTDLLLYKAIRPSAGYTSVYTNFGKIRNKGFEFGVKYDKDINDDWKITASLSGNTIKNKIIDCGQTFTNSNTGLDAGYHWANNVICRNGYPVGSYYGYKTAGIIQSQSELDALNAEAVSKGYSYYQLAGTKVGDLKFVDVDGDGHISTSDMTILGDGFPDLNFQINLGASYKNWDFSVYSYGTLGQHIYSVSAMRLSVLTSSSGAVHNILKSAFNDAWVTSYDDNGVAVGGTGTIPRLSMTDANQNSRASDYWIKNGNYLRISNIQVGYTFDKKLLKSLLISSARVYFSISNLACISPYNKYGDPEIGSSSVLKTGLDVGRYPNPRTYSFGLNVEF